MTQELEPIDEQGKYPDVPPDVPGWYMPSVVVEPPEWTVVRPPFDPNSQLEKIWSDCLYLPRLIAVGFLWITLAWWRSGIAALIVSIVIILFKAG